MLQQLLNKTFNKDCLGTEGLALVPAKSVDMILCDLPYGTTQCKWDSVIDLPRLWEQYERIIKDNGAIVLTAQTPFTEVLGASNLKLLRYKWIWEKTEATGHLNAKKMPMKAHEDILVFYKNLPTYNPIKTTGHERKTATRRHAEHKNNLYGALDKGVSSYDSTERYPRSVLVFPKDKQKSKLHPTQKPVPLFEYLIRTYTNAGDVVLDNSAGSGTTAIACLNANRNYILWEWNDQGNAYYSPMVQRIEKHREMLISEPCGGLNR